MIVVTQPLRPSDRWRYAAAPAVALLLAACDASGPGRAAYREGRFEEALVAWRDADAAAGESAPAELAYDRALAALRAGKIDESESAADEAAARDGPGFAALRDFLRGNIAFARCLAAEVETFRPGAGASAYDEGIAHAETARKAWERAAASRDDWPEARRNAERAVLAAARLAARKAEAESQPDRPKSAKSPQVKDAPPPLPLPLPPRQGAVPPSPTPSQLAELPRAEVLALLERLAEKERQKLELRREQQRPKTPAERDW